MRKARARILEAVEAPVLEWLHCLIFISFRLNFYAVRLLASKIIPQVHGGDFWPSFASLFFDGFGQEIEVDDGIVRTSPS